MTALVLGSTLRHLHHTERSTWRASLVARAAVACLPALTAGAFLLTGRGGGLSWLLVQFLSGTAVAAHNAWILPIEIRR